MRRRKSFLILKGMGDDKFTMSGNPYSGVQKRIEPQQTHPVTAGLLALIRARLRLPTRVPPAPNLHPANPVRRALSRRLRGASFRPARGLQPDLSARLRPPHPASQSCPYQSPQVRPPRKIWLIEGGQHGLIKQVKSKKAKVKREEFVRHPLFFATDH